MRKLSKFTNGVVLSVTQKLTNMETSFLDQLIEEHQNHIESVEAASYAGIPETRKQLAELEAIKAIIVTRCCETLKTKKAPTFEYWLICNFEETKTGKYIDFNNGDTYRDNQVLKLKYNKIFKPTLY